MVPGWKDCTKMTGWHLEYTGYMMAAHISYQKGNYICVDKTPEGYPHGEADQNGDLLYTVEIQCGTLPCSPYKSGAEVPCAVCSR